MDIFELLGVQLHFTTNQPGTQSATFQVALGCGCVTMLYPVTSHKFLVKEHSFYVETEADIYNVFARIAESNSLLTQEKGKSYSIACEKLDYKVLAERICK